MVKPNSICNNYYTVKLSMYVRLSTLKCNVYCEIARIGPNFDKQVYNFNCIPRNILNDTISKNYYTEQKFSVDLLKISKLQEIKYISLKLGFLYSFQFTNFEVDQYSAFVQYRQKYLHIVF